MKRADQERQEKGRLTKRVDQQIDDLVLAVLSRQVQRRIPSLRSQTRSLSYLNTTTHTNTYALKLNKN